MIFLQQQVDDIKQSMQDEVNTGQQKQVQELQHIIFKIVAIVAEFDLEEEPMQMFNIMVIIKKA